MISEENDWHNFAQFQNKANENYFILFQAVENLQIQKQHNQIQIQALSFATVLNQEN